MDSIRWRLHSSREKAAEVAARHSIPRVCASYEELLDDRALRCSTCRSAHVSARPDSRSLRARDGEGDSGAEAAGAQLPEAEEAVPLLRAGRHRTRGQPEHALRSVGLRRARLLKEGIFGRRFSPRSICARCCTGSRGRPTWVQPRCASCRSITWIACDGGSAIRNGFLPAPAPIRVPNSRITTESARRFRNMQAACVA